MGRKKCKGVANNAINCQSFFSENAVIFLGALHENNENGSLSIFGITETISPEQLVTEQTSRPDKQTTPTKKQSGTRLTVPDCFQAHPCIKTYGARPY
ncbi:hypothetical protein MY727_05980 [Haemophilus influenzae]|nr:hypothetical protein [Haemophilus influenzae]